MDVVRRLSPPRTQPIKSESTRIDNECYDLFGERWWDPSGPVAGLHSMNPTRCRYIDRVFQAHFGPAVKNTGRFVDIGCGGGLVTEELSRKGYRIIGFDTSANSLEAARKHAADANVEAEYRYGSVYDLEIESASIDGVVICDVLEHLHDLPAAVSELSRVLKMGGVMVFDTINRTLKSYLLMIVLVQRVAKIVVPDTHDWRLFITPDELKTVLAENGLSVRELVGMTPAKGIFHVIANFLRGKSLGEFRTSANLATSFIGHAEKTCVAKGTVLSGNIATTLQRR